MTEVQDPDAELLDQWRRGNSAAGVQLYERHAHAIIRFFRNKVNTSADMEELVQETFVRVLGALGRIRHGRAVRSFMLRTAQNVLHEHLRMIARDREINPEIDSIAELQAGPSTVAARKREHRLLLEALRRLPLQHQIVLELYYLEGMKANELAELMGTQHSTMRGRVQRARDLLKQTIAELGESAPLIASTIEGLDSWAEGIRRLMSE